MEAPEILVERGRRPDDAPMKGTKMNTASAGGGGKVAGSVPVGGSRTSLGNRHTPGDVSLHRAAIVAGLGLLVMFLLAFASFSAFEGLVVEEMRPARRATSPTMSSLFRSVTCGFVIVAGLDVLVAWALYILLGPVNPSIAVLAAWPRVVYAAVFAAALSNLVVAVNLLSDVNARSAFGPPQLNAQVMTSVNQFQDGWNLALVLFGLHLLVLGYLVFKSTYIPSILGILVAIASLGYLVDSFGGFLSKSYDANVALLTLPGEVLLMGWPSVERSETASASGSVRSATRRRRCDTTKRSTP